MPDPAIPVSDAAERDIPDLGPLEPGRLPPPLSPAFARICAALAHPGRRAIFELLGRQPELSAGEISRVFQGVTRQAVSAHLQVLLKVGLVRVRPRARYAVDRRDSPERQALAALDALEHQGGTLLYSQDPAPLGLLVFWLQLAAPAQLATAGGPSRSSDPAGP